MTEVAASPVFQSGDEPTPVAPPRRKRKKQKLRQFALENSSENDVRDASLDVGCGAQKVAVQQKSPQQRPRALTLENGIDGETATNTPRRLARDTGSADCLASPTNAPVVNGGSPKTSKMLIETALFQPSVAPPRRKRKKQKLRQFALENSTENDVRDASLDAGCGAQKVAVQQKSPQQRPRALTLENGIDGETATNTPRRLARDIGSADCLVSPTDAPVVNGGSPKKSKMLIETALFQPSTSRVENYYSGTETRRQSAPGISRNQLLDKSDALCKSLSLSPGAVVESVSPSNTLRRSRGKQQMSPTKSSKPPPPRPSATPSRPPRQPHAAASSVTGCGNKTATYSQLYAPQAAVKSTLVIDTKCSQFPSGDIKQKLPPRVYRGQGCSGSRSRYGTTKPDTGHKDDPSHAYGRRAQAALNKLASTVMKFNKSSSVGSSGSSSEKQSKKTQRKGAPPKRPPPAVRNTPRPPLAKMLSHVDVSAEENLYANEYDDHIYMEIGFSKSKTETDVTCYSKGPAVKEEDPYVIMNPDEDSNIYTPLDFSTRNESEGQYMYKGPPINVLLHTMKLHA